MNPLYEYDQWKKGGFPASVGEWEDWAERIVNSFQSELSAANNDHNRYKRLKSINAELLQACKDALFVLQNKSYLNTEVVRDTLENILTEAIRKAQQ